MPPARAERRQPAPFPGYQATTGVRPEQAARDALPGHPLARHIDDFLADLANANRPRNTIRAYRGDLTGFAAHHDGEIAGLTAAPVRAFLAEIAGQAPSTRKRKRAAVASFCKWAVRHELLDASPMDRIDAIQVPRTLPRPAAAADVAAVLDVICPGDRARTCRSTCSGTGCCSRRPTSAAPAPRRSAGCTSRTWTCARTTSTPASTARAAPSAPCCSTTAATSRCSGCTSPGPGTRRARCSAPVSNGRGGPLSYDAAHSRWKKYCAAAGAGIGVHQLRHAHASELINSGVSIEVVRRRLGHASAQTTQVYTLLADRVADAEIRAARRRRGRSAS